MTSQQWADWVVFFGGHMILLGAIAIYTIWSGWPWLPKPWVHRLWACDALWCLAWFLGPGSWIVLISVAVASLATVGFYLMYWHKTNP